MKRYIKATSIPEPTPKQKLLGSKLVDAFLIYCKIPKSEVTKSGKILADTMYKNNTVITYERLLSARDSFLQVKKPYNNRRDLNKECLYEGVHLIIYKKVLDKIKDIYDLYVYPDYEW